MHFCFLFYKFRSKASRPSIVLPVTIEDVGNVGSGPRRRQNLGLVRLEGSSPAGATLTETIDPLRGFETCFIRVSYLVSHPAHMCWIALCITHAVREIMSSHRYEALPFHRV